MKQARKRIDGQAGYMLLSVMLLVTVMLLALAIELPRISQQIKREKEEELVHRGMDYAMAIKRFVHKTGRYPASLEQLEDTNHVRFLRKRYKDPMTTEGEWRLIHQGEAQIKLTAPSSLPTTSPTPPPGGPVKQGETPPSSLTTQNIGTSQPVGGGAIIGVASTSKATSIKEFNDQTTYDGWLFVYDPRLEQSGGPGILIAAPTGNTAGPTGTQGQSGSTTNPGSGASGPSPTPPPTPSQLPQ